MKLVEKLPHDNLCFVGDIIDRGADSKECFEFVKRYKCVLGNHEEMMLCDTPYNTDYSGLWLRNGGYNTLTSFNQDVIELIAWAKSLPIYIEYKNFIISHSYVGHVWEGKYGHSSEEFKHTALWNRSFPKSQLPEGHQNVFGHTPVKDVQFIDGGIDIDTGCCYGYKLSAIDLEDMTVYQQTNVEG